MPTLHNPAENSLFCQRLERILGIDERVEITDEEAADLVGGAVFVVEGYEAPEVEEPEGEDADEADEDAEPSATPRRASAKRGAKQVEVTEAPNVEKRG